jgi:hypothetical protein
MSQLNVNRVVDASGGVLAPISSVMRNRIINGAMVIDQRNAGASVTQTTANTFTVDRWFGYGDVTSKFTMQQNAGAVTPPAGFTNYLGVTSLSAYTIVSGTEQYVILQNIEGFNISDLGWGTANAKTVTLSFWTRSSLTGNFGGALRNSDNSRSYPFSYTINSANTWEQKSITIAGDTSGTWLTNNGRGIRLNFSLGAGATLSGTADVWASTSYVTATGATSVVGTNGATWYVTGVQLEVGTQATSFEYRQFGQELALCQRYYQEVGTAAANEYIYTFYGLSGSTYFIPSPLPVAMRAAPTVTVVGTWGLSQVSSFTAAASANAYRLNIVTSGTGNITIQNNGSNSKLTFAIEL